MSYLFGILFCLQVTPEIPVELLAKYTSAEDAETAGHACWEIFAQIDPSDAELERLSNHEDPGIAIQATRRLYHRTLPFSASSHAGPLVYHAPDLNRFLGLTQGRLGVSIPKWWERMLESADLFHPDRTRLPTETPISLQDVVIESEIAELKVGKESVFVPANVIRWMQETNSMKEYQVIRSKDDVYVLSVPFARSSPRLACISISGKKERWRQELWGASLPTFSSGPPAAEINVVSLQVSGSFATVFGSHSFRRPGSEHYFRSDLYFEQFRIVDGTSTVRFATNNWGPMLNRMVFR